MNNIIELKGLQKGQAVSGLVFVQDYQQSKPSGKMPLKGSLHHKGLTMAFKVWSGFTQDMFIATSLKGVVLDITGSVDEYQGKKDINITTAQIVADADVNMFYKTVANIDLLSKELGTYVTAMAPNYVEALSVFFRDENLHKVFNETWAGKMMHDAQVGGLLNHTLKMLRIANTMIANDTRLKPYQSLLFLSIMLHDIGKVYEIGQGGAYTNVAFVTHRTLGVEMVSRHKQTFVSLIGEEDFYQLLAVIQGHHGEYGDKPTTMWAQLIHLIDMVDAQTTGFFDKIENNDVTEKNGNLMVWMGTDLVFKRKEEPVDNPVIM